MTDVSAGSTALVTGVCGFIGSHVAEALLRRGCRVVGLDNFDPFYDRSIKERSLSAVQQTAELVGAPFEFHEQDIADAASSEQLLEACRPNAVIHLAARAGVRPSIADPAGYAHTNVLGTQIMLEAARRVRCDRFVLASSSSVYGNNAKVPFAEDDDVSFPISPYAATKRACELAAHTHHHLTKMPTACLRFFTVFGPRQRPDLAITSFMRRIAAGEAIRMFGDGSTSRDYTYIDDIVAGVLAAMDRIPRYGYRIWNLGSDRPIRLDEMIAAIERVVGRGAIIRRESMQPGDVDRTCADIARSTRELGYQASADFETGLAQQWAAMTTNEVPQGI